MKKYIIRVLTLITLLGPLTSCNNWLDVTASDQIKADDLFKTRGGFRDALLGVYVGMGNRASYGSDLSFLTIDILSKQYNSLTEFSVNFDMDNFRYGTSRSSERIRSIWNRHYENIANINLALSYIEKNGTILSNIERSIIKGEFLALRAFSHFELMRLFGYGNFTERPELLQRPAIPYVTVLTKEQTGQLSYEETFKVLEKDIQDALVLLQEDPAYPNAQRPSNYFEEANRDGLYNNRNIRMNYFAAKALQARVLQWQGKKQQAAAAAEEVIAHSFARLTTPNVPERRNYILMEEVIFGLQIEQLNGTVAPYLEQAATTNYEALFMPRASAQNLYEVSNPLIGVADIRFNTLLQDRQLGFVSLKFAPYSGAGLLGGRDIFPMMKLPEQFYIAAEYYIKTNPAKAISYLNQVRASRSIVQPISDEAGEEILEIELTKEYRKEYVAEGQLFYYYKRNGFQTLPGQSANLVMNDEKYILPYPDNEIQFGNRVQF